MSRARESGTAARLTREGEVPGDQVRVGTVVNAAVADAILGRVAARYFPKDAVTAFGSANGRPLTLPPGRGREAVIR